MGESRAAEAAAAAEKAAACGARRVLGEGGRRRGRGERSHRHTCAHLERNIQHEFGTFPLGGLIHSHTRRCTVHRGPRPLLSEPKKCFGPQTKQHHGNECESVTTNGLGHVIACACLWSRVRPVPVRARRLKRKGWAKHGQPANAPRPRSEFPPRSQAAGPAAHKPQRRASLRASDPWSRPHSRPLFTPPLPIPPPLLLRRRLRIVRAA